MVRVKQLQHLERVYIEGYQLRNLVKVGERSCLPTLKQQNALFVQAL